MRSFFLGNGFNHVIDQNDHENPEFVASWGVSDEDLLNRAHQEFLARHTRGQLFFAYLYGSEETCLFWKDDAHDGIFFCYTGL